MNATTEINIVGIDEIEKRYGPGEGRHRFSKSTMAFFKCRLAAYGFEGPGGLFFVFSEKGPSGIRAYSVRQLTDRDIKTVGEFGGYATSAMAHRVAKKLAGGAA